MQHQVRWGAESGERGRDPHSGATIFQVTSAAAISNNVYCEQPYTTPDGRRVAIIRRNDFCFPRETPLLVADLLDRRIALVEDSIVGGLCNAAWSGIVYYWDKDRRLIRLNMADFDREVVYEERDADQTLSIHSVSPDQRYIIYNHSSKAIGRLDLQTGTREVIFERDGLGNSHAQFNPVHGERFMVQQELGDDIRLWTVRADGHDARELNVGAPTSARPTGHEVFIADTGRVALTTNWNTNLFTPHDRDPSGEIAVQTDDWSLDRRYKMGNLLLAPIDGGQPVALPAPEHRFNHLSVSRCGRYFVADSFLRDTRKTEGTPWRLALVIGNLQTGRYRTLLNDCMASGGSNQCTHPHAYFTADNRFVVYNADPYHSVPQVYAAMVPPAFLDSLN